ncbi:OmpA family protein [Endozoicomonas sp.]|uniref:OmpA family protein n=1 Tax=Endozoicomonas sp. TaxID=1892382 RepID=UPI002886A46B|nr:OmpA family protein [Endozoicomonas sp.]
MQLKKLFAVATLLMGALLAGCQTTNPYTGDQQASKSTKYGLGGVLAGAAIGALADGGEGAWKGALIGGAAGSGYGYYLDNQENRLRAELQGTGVQVYREGDQLKLIMPSNITFDSSKSDIKSAFYPVLGSVARVFNEYDRNLIQVVGYTDSTGGDKINLPLSQARADSVANYIAFQGVDGSRITGYGRGSMDPVASNNTSEGRAKNRRVEINLLPVPQR